MKRHRQRALAALAAYATLGGCLPACELLIGVKTPRLNECASTEESGSTPWMATFKGGATTSLAGIAVTPSDGVILLGSFDIEDRSDTSNVDAPSDTSNEDLSVAMLDPQKQTSSWTARFSSIGKTARATSIVTDESGHCFVMSEGCSVTRLNCASGDVELPGTLGPSGEQCFHMTASSDYILVAGKLTDSVFIDRYDSDLEKQGRISFPCKQCERPRIARVKDGFWVAGSFTGSVDLDGSLGSGPEVASSGGDDIFVARFDMVRFDDDTPGPPSVRKLFGGTKDQKVLAIAAPGTDDANDEGILLTGSFAGTIDFGAGADAAGKHTAASLEDVFVARLDKEGEHVWSRRLGDDDEQKGTSIAIHAGRVAIAGNYVAVTKMSMRSPEDSDPLPPSKQPKSFVTVRDLAKGDLVWSDWNIANDPQGDTLASFDKMGALFIAGTFIGSVDFDCESVESRTGAADIFIAKLPHDRINLQHD